jgi:hypothetical protein
VSSPVPKSELLMSQLGQSMTTAGAVTPWEANSCPSFSVGVDLPLKWRGVRGRVLRPAGRA